MMRTESRFRRSRRGITVVEATVALVVIGAAATVGARTLFSAAGHRRATAQRSTAAIEVANAMEHAMASDLPSDLSTGAAPSDAATREVRPLSKEAARVLPQGELTVSIEPPTEVEGGAALSQRVAVELRWKNSAGEWAAPARLSAWKHRPKASVDAAPNEAAPNEAAP
jgi:type II secretory pathway pseudopilin PulG